MPGQLPNAQKARINCRKLRDYALNTKHDTGKYKAAFFYQMGYTVEKWATLEDEIRSQHLTQPADTGQPSPFGQKYTITALLQGPQGEPRWGNNRMDHSLRRRPTRTYNDRASNEVKGSTR